MNLGVNIEQLGRSSTGCIHELGQAGVGLRVGDEQGVAEGQPVLLGLFRCVLRRKRRSGFVRCAVVLKLVLNLGILVYILTVCPRSIDPIYIVIYNMKIVKTSWKEIIRMLLVHCVGK